MSPQRWVLFFLSILTGIGLGLLYGWVLSPIEYVDTSPDTLRADFRADYTLMVAEVYETEQSIEAASRRLAALGAKPPAQLAREGLEFARTHQFSEQDIDLLQDMLFDLEAARPAGAQP
jgi:hypothetical protein